MKISGFQLLLWIIVANVCATVGGVILAMLLGNM